MSDLFWVWSGQLFYVFKLLSDLLRMHRELNKNYLNGLKVYQKLLNKISHKLKKTLVSLPEKKIKRKNRMFEHAFLDVTPHRSLPDAAQLVTLVNALLDQVDPHAKRKLTVYLILDTLSPCYWLMILGNSSRWCSECSSTSWSDSWHCKNYWCWWCNRNQCRWKIYYDVLELFKTSCMLPPSHIKKPNSC